MWIVQIWTGSAWTCVCSDNTAANGRKSLREMAANQAGRYRLMGPDGKVIARAEGAHGATLARRREPGGRV